MKKLSVIIAMAVIFLTVSLFSNVRPTQAQMEILGFLQSLSLLLPSGNKTTEKTPTIEEIIEYDSHIDVISTTMKQKIVDYWATAEKKVILDFNGATVENRIINNWIVAWYDNARVNNSNGIIIIFSTLPDNRNTMRSFCTYWFDPKNSTDMSELKSILQSSEAKNTFLRETAEKYYQ